MRINIITALQNKLDTNILNMMQEYEKRLPWKINYQNCYPNTENKMLQIIKPPAIAMDANGYNYSSEEMASELEKLALHGNNSVTFVIGPHDGLSDSIKKMCNKHWALGRITLPHQMVQLVLIEQLYRCWAIINNIKYHK